MPDQIRDSIIIGAGPAGLTAASQLAAAGKDVLLLDRCTFPREKVCGDGLVGDSLGCLERLGLLDQVRRQARIVEELTIRSRSGQEVNLTSGFWTIKRIHLDSLLWRRACDAGAEFRTLAIDTVWYDEDGFFCCSGSGPDALTTRFKARYGIIATGTSGIRNDRIGIMPVQADNAVALRCYVRSDSVLNRLEGAFESYLAPGYAWIFPLCEQEYNVGCIRFCTPGRPRNPNLRQLFETFCTSHPAARALFDRARSVSPVRAHPLRCGREVRDITDGVATLLAGETIGTTYPFTGEGVGKAMETGETAAQVLLKALEQGNNSPLCDYPDLLSRRFRNTYEGYAKAQRWLFRKGLNDIIIRQTARSALLRREISRMILDETTPAAVLTAGTFFKSFFS